MKAGQKCEDAIADFAKAFGCWSHNFNDRNEGRHNRGKARRPADRIFCHLGRLVLAECKETHSARLAFSALETHQARALDKVERSGGVGMVAVMAVQRPASRLWLLHFHEWMELEATLGRASIPLRDGVRPSVLWEAPRVPHPRGFVGTVFDLRPWLDSSAS